MKILHVTSFRNEIDARGLKSMGIGMEGGSDKIRAFSGNTAVVTQLGIALMDETFDLVSRASCVMTASSDGVSGRFVNHDGGEMRMDPEELDPSSCCSEPVVSGISSDSLERVEGEMTSGEKYSDECVDPAGEIVAVAGCGAGGGTGIGED